MKAQEKKHLSEIVNLKLAEIGKSVISEPEHNEAEVEEISRKIIDLLDELQTEPVNAAGALLTTLIYILKETTDVE